MAHVTYKFRFIVVNTINDGNGELEIVLGGFHTLLCAECFCKAFLGEGNWEHIGNVFKSMNTLDNLIIKDTQNG